jgi:hypothetical protein
MNPDESIKWIGVWGDWEVGANGLRYIGRGRSTPVNVDGLLVGIAVSNIDRFIEGEIEARLRFENVDGQQHTGGIILGFKSMKEPVFLC